MTLIDEHPNLQILQVSEDKSLLTTENRDAAIAYLAKQRNDLLRLASDYQVYENQTYSEGIEHVQSYLEQLVTNSSVHSENIVWPEIFFTKPEDASPIINFLEIPPNIQPEGIYNASANAIIIFTNKLLSRCELNSRIFHELGYSTGVKEVYVNQKDRHLGISRSGLTTLRRSLKKDKWIEKTLWEEVFWSYEQGAYKLKLLDEDLEEKNAFSELIQQYQRLGMVDTQGRILFTLNGLQVSIKPEYLIFERSVEGVYNFKYSVNSFAGQIFENILHGFPADERKSIESLFIQARFDPQKIGELQAKIDKAWGKGTFISLHNLDFQNLSNIELRNLLQKFKVD